MKTTETSVELIELVETSGLEKSKQNQIAETLGVFFLKAKEWDDTIKSIVITSPEEKGKMKMAKEGRLTLKNMRLEAEKIVKAKRDEVKYSMANFVLEDKLWLKAGQMMEATFKNLETKLEEKEKFAEMWETEQKEKRTGNRLSELLEWSENDPMIDRGIIENMDDETFKGYLVATKKMKEEKIRLENERIAKEKAEAEERERIRIENEKLKLEAIAKEKEIEKERAKAEKEKANIEKKAREQKSIADAKLKEERKENEKLQEEIRAKAEKERQIKLETLLLHKKYPLGYGNTKK